MVILTHLLSSLQLMFQSLTTILDATYAQQDMLTAATAALNYVRYRGSDLCPLSTCFGNQELVSTLETCFLAPGS
jgi:hypothetical protein